MNNETPTTVVEVTPDEVEREVDLKEQRTEILREMSKEYGVNLFDAEGLKQFKVYQDAKKSEQEKLQEQLKALEDEKATWHKEKLEYQSKLKASELGIASEFLEDALTLAGGNPEALVTVVEKYPMFKVKGKINIGIQQPTTTVQPNELSEVDAFMAKDPRYQAYYNKNKKQ